MGRNNPKYHYVMWMTYQINFILQGFSFPLAISLCIVLYLTLFDDSGLLDYSDPRSLPYPLFPVPYPLTASLLPFLPFVFWFAPFLDLWLVLFVIIWL